MNNNLSYQFKTMNVALKLIVINVTIFLFTRIFAFLFKFEVIDLTQWFVLSSSFFDWIKQPWSIISYSFLHGNFRHILWNMVSIYIFSRFILNLFSGKRYLTIYLLGAIFGGLLFLMSYKLFPVFNNAPAYLIGASASATAAMVFIATYSPNTVFRLFIWNIKLWQIALFFFISDLLNLGSGINPGGVLAHIGGAIFGYVYAIQLAKGNDLGKWFEDIMDWFTGLFKTRKQKPFTKVHRNTKKTRVKTTQKTTTKPDNQKKIDAILDKISKSGYDSLTKAEKDFLFKAGKE